MYPDLAVLINAIQRSNLKQDKPLVCRAVQEYYKLLHKGEAVKTTAEKRSDKAKIEKKKADDKAKKAEEKVKKAVEKEAKKSIKKSK